MAYDAGLEPVYFYDTWAVDRLIEFLDDQFDLVMISEFMEASMVLLAETMCWPLEEVAFVTLNARPKTATVRTALTDAEMDKLREVNAADVQIYKYFKEKFGRRVEEYGTEKMLKKVSELNELNQRLAGMCIDKVIPPEEPSKDYPVFTYQINEGAPDICKLVVMEELKFTDLLKAQQLERFSHLDDFDDLTNA